MMRDEEKLPRLIKKLTTEERQEFKKMVNVATVTEEAFQEQAIAKLEEMLEEMDEKHLDVGKAVSEKYGSVLIPRKDVNVQLNARICYVERLRENGVRALKILDGEELEYDSETSHLFRQASKLFRERQKTDLTPRTRRLMEEIGENE